MELMTVIAEEEPVDLSPLVAELLRRSLLLERTVLYFFGPLFDFGCDNELQTNNVNSE